MKNNLLLPQIAIGEPMEQKPLGSRQRNALCLLFGRKDFTPEEVAKLDYAQVERQPKIGRKGIEEIRAWLQSYGYDLNNLPTGDKQPARKRLHLRLKNAARLLTRNGYRVDPPLH